MRRTPKPGFWRNDQRSYFLTNLPFGHSRPVANSVTRMQYHLSSDWKPCEHLREPIVAMPDFDDLRLRTPVVDGEHRPVVALSE